MISECPDMKREIQLFSFLPDTELKKLETMYQEFHVSYNNFRLYFSFHLFLHFMHEGYKVIFIDSVEYLNTSIELGIFTYKFINTWR
jgi:hypothetical protein